MIEKLFVSNYRCLVNCEIPFTPITLLLGQNGAGKSGIFDLLSAIKKLVGGAALVSECFPNSELTRWQTLNEQKFELTMRGQSGLFLYSLCVKHQRKHKKSRIFSEKLTLDGDQLLFDFEQGEISLYNDRPNIKPVNFSFNPNRSGLSFVEPRDDNTKLTEFKSMLDKIIILRPNPPLMASDSQEESEALAIDAANFASWYRLISRHDLKKQHELFNELNAVIEGFESMKLEGPADGTVTLKIQVRTNGQTEPSSYKLSELSDGQRQLLLLYALLFGQNNEGRTILLDEPDNYVALREIQPWLGAIVDSVGRSMDQVIFISHNPEIVDHLAYEKGIWFEREGAGETRVGHKKQPKDDPLKPSEMEARGWSK